MFRFSGRKSNDTNDKVNMRKDEEDLERYEQLLSDWKPGPGPAKEGRSKPARVDERKFNDTQENPEDLFQPKPTAPKPQPVRSATAAQNAQPTRTSTASPQPKKQTPSAAPQPSATVMSEPAMMNPFVMGSILLINGRTLVVYKQQMPDKHLVMVLCPNGSVKVQALPLETAKPEMIGQQIDHLGEIAHEYFEVLKHRMRWDRDLIVFHCYSYEDTKRVPVMMNSTAQPTPLPSDMAAEMNAANEHMDSAQPDPMPEPKPAGPQRGQRIKVQFGARDWEAVYWGKDDQGTVVAHHTNDTWALMHLDLDRFGKGIEIQNEIDLILVKEIEKSLQG